jgi:nucleoside-diphosphate-sugar epimerase
MTNKNEILIIGAGWLGFPLAKHWKNNGFSVVATTTNKEKLEALKANKIDAIPFILGVNNFDILPDKPIVFVNIPPKMQGFANEADYKGLLVFLLARNPEQLVFVSSTGVYGTACKGKVDEDTEPKPDENSNGFFLKKLEDLVLLKGYSVLRPGGLFGENRNPSQFFRSKGIIPNSEDAINMIHLSELIKITDFLISNKVKGIINAVNPEKISRATFYNYAAKVNGLPLLKSDGIFSNAKWVHPKNLLNLGYPFKYLTSEKYLDE